MKKIPFSSVLATIVTVAVVAVAGYGLFLSGSPTKERERRMDDQRVDNLRQITYAIDAYWLQKNNLPASLDELQRMRDVYLPSVSDPKTDEPYAYRITAGKGSYELCAVFETASVYDRDKSVPGPEGSMFWNHGAGRACYALEARDLSKNIRF